MASNRDLVVGMLVITVLCQTYSAHPINEVPVLSGRAPLTELPCISGPLGMESGAIPDSSITASSTSGGYLPRNARLNSGGGWIPVTPEDQWIQVDLSDYTAITGIIIQALVNNRWWVTSFSVMYSRTGESHDWQSLTDVEGEIIQLNGVTSSGETVTVNFPSVLTARFIRILPISWSAENFRLLFEVLGCRGPVSSYDGMVRLVDGDDDLSGRVEIFHHETYSWGAVCDAAWDMADANVVCRQIADHLEAVEAKTGSFFGGTDRPVVMNRVSCKGTESRLADCPFVCTRYQQCNDSHEAGVVCRPKLNTVRLVGGSNNASGRVEIYRDDTWGTVCDNDWDATDGAVVCRQLGFSGAVEVKSGAHYGQGSGPVHLDGVACVGSESELGNCPSLCWKETSCNHSQDAGVICRSDSSN